MRSNGQMIIDAYAHIIPPKYKEIMQKMVPEIHDRLILPELSLWDLDQRFRIMDKYEPIRQVLTLGRIPVEHIAGPEKAAELAMRADDEMAELEAKYPHRFAGAVATLAINNLDAALKETDRAIKDLGFKGVYVHTPVDEKPLDLPEFRPLFEKMCRYDLPIILHPMRKYDHPDYLTEKESKYDMAHLFGWPYDTTSAMARLVFSGIMEEFPTLKVVTHHLGGMVPFYSTRIEQFTQYNEKRQYSLIPRLKKDAIEYFRRFYADTATYGNPKALACGIDFFGADHVFFGIDFPLADTEYGDRNYRETIKALEQVEIADEDKKKIYEENARRVMGLRQGL